LATDQVTARWFALWTHSHCEQLVHDQLAAKGFRVFLPTMRTWSRRAGKQRLIPVPMFQGYLFINHAIDKCSYIEILKTRGLVRILGGQWDELLPVADAEIDALERIQDAGVPVLPHAYLHDGQRVRINTGPLAGVEGVLVRSRPNRGVLVLSVDLLRQSVAVEVDCTAVMPAGEWRPVPGALAFEGRLASVN
jgi:transcription termination/antitermination protein NusG